MTAHSYCIWGARIMLGKYRECLDLTQIMQGAGKALRGLRDINTAVDSIWMRGGKDTASLLEG